MSVFMNHFTSPAMKNLGYGLSAKDRLVLLWGGLRGALALTLGLIIELDRSIDQDIRDRVLFHAAGIAALTLLVMTFASKNMRL